MREKIKFIGGIGMINVNLDRVDVENLLRGIEPSFNIMSEIPRDLGKFCGGFVDKWAWNYKFPDRYSDEYLLELYYKIKEHRDEKY